MPLPPDPASDKKDRLIATALNPELYVWIAVLLFGTVAAGWVLIGVGMLFALIPVLGLPYFWTRKAHP